MKEEYRDLESLAVSPNGDRWLLRNDGRYKTFLAAAEDYYFIASFCEFNEWRSEHRRLNQRMQALRSKPEDAGVVRYLHEKVMSTFHTPMGVATFCYHFACELFLKHMKLREAFVREGFTLRNIRTGGAVQRKPKGPGKWQTPHRQIHSLKELFQDLDAATQRSIRDSYEPWRAMNSIRDVDEVRDFQALLDILDNEQIDIKYHERLVDDDALFYRAGVMARFLRDYMRREG